MPFHAGSLEALRVTRAEAVGLERTNGRTVPRLAIANAARDSSWRDEIFCGGQRPAIFFDDDDALAFQLLLDIVRPAAAHAVLEGGSRTAPRPAPPIPSRNDAAWKTTPPLPAGSPAGRFKASFARRIASAASPFHPAVQRAVPILAAFVQGQIVAFDPPRRRPELARSTADRRSAAYSPYCSFSSSASISASAWAISFGPLR